MSSSIYVRARPALRVEETYRYVASVRETSITTPQRNSSGGPDHTGRIRVSLPYLPNRSGPGLQPDGRRLLESLEREGRLAADAEAVIAYVGVERPRPSGQTQDPLAELDQALGSSVPGVPRLGPGR